MNEHADQPAGQAARDGRVVVEIQFPADWADEIHAEFERAADERPAEGGELIDQTIESDDADFVIAAGLVIVTAKWLADAGAGYAFGKAVDKLVDKVRKKRSREGTEPTATVLLPDGTVVILDASNPEELAKNIKLIKQAGS